MQNYWTAVRRLKDWGIKGSIIQSFEKEFSQSSGSPEENAYCMLLLLEEQFNSDALCCDMEAEDYNALLFWIRHVTQGGVA